MARRRRRLYEGAIHHAGARGNRRQAIFADDRDRRSYLSLLTETCRRYGWLCHGYCLMGNHYHLLIETPYANLDEGMRYLNGVYATRFNRRHAVDGHLFQGRYWAEEIRDDGDLLRVVRYIARNPVEAGLCERAEQWQWSSHRLTIAPTAFNQLLTVRLVLGVLGARQLGLNSARAQLRRLVDGSA